MASAPLCSLGGPDCDGGIPVTKYRVRAQRRNSANRVVATKYSSYLPPAVRFGTLRLARGRYTFAVRAWNKVGASPWSGTSAAVRAR